jgi:hypothetical protein
LSCNGGYWFGNRCFRLPGWRRGGLEVLEGFEGAEVHAVGGVNAAVDAGEGVESVLVGVAEGGIVPDGGVEEFGMAEIFVKALDLVIPKLGFDAAEAALDPLGGDEGVDERELGRRGGGGGIGRRGPRARRDLPRE